MRAERVGADTLLAQIVRMVSEAQRSRAPIQRLADVVSALFRAGRRDGGASSRSSPGSLLGPEPRLAHALVNAVAVLIIACPCAWGWPRRCRSWSATGRGADGRRADQERRGAGDPGTGRHAGRRQDRHADRGQAAARRRSRRCDGFDEAELLRLAASLEQASEHPLAAAIVTAGARERGSISARSPAVPVASPARAWPARSKGTTRGHRQPGAAGRAGRRARTPCGREPTSLRRRRQTVVFVAVDGRPAGLLGVADPIKATTPRAHATTCATEGLRIIMLTGDNRTTAEAVARQLGIDEVRCRGAPRSEERRDQRAAGGRPHRGDGRRRHQRCAGAGRRPASASRWAPAPTWRWRAPA